VRVNANLKAPTVEEWLGRKKAMHLASFDLMVEEIRSCQCAPPIRPRAEVLHKRLYRDGNADHLAEILSRHHVEKYVGAS
jgi:hypothetical protein